MQNSEAVQAWFQGKMASFRILGLVSKNEIRSREFSFSSRSLRVKIINLDLVSMPEIGGNFFSVSSRSLRVSVRNSRSRLDERDWIGETLILVSRLKKRLSLTTGSLWCLGSSWHYCSPGRCHRASEPGSTTDCCRCRRHCWLPWIWIISAGTFRAKYLNQWELFG